MVISALQYLSKPIFGAFEREEFKKFLRMGGIFALIIGSYWTMRVLKDAVFINLVGKAMLPTAKLVSLAVLFPVVMIYTKLLDRYSREKMFYLTSAFYGAGALFFGLLLYFNQVDADVIATYEGMHAYFVRILGYAIYVFVESYGSLIVSLFWAFATDTTDSNSAKRGFYLVTALGQLGGIVGPKYIASLPKRMDFITSAAAFFACALFMGLVGVLVKYLITVTPKNLMSSFHGKNEAAAEKEQEPGFFEGLRLLLSHGYLLGIFFTIVCFEVIVTVFDFNFKYLAATQHTGRALDAYLGDYGSLVNVVALVCLLLGVSNITRILGVGVALVLMPIIVGGALTGFLTFDNLDFLFYLMVGSKAINYALNGPAMKQLYIPTTHDVRFKAQAWIETFGSRGSKGASSAFNNTLAVFQKSLGPVAGKARYMFLTGVVGYSLVAVWFLVAIYLGRTYTKAVDEKRVVC